jgi:hypothetical protein
MMQVARLISYNFIYALEVLLQILILLLLLLRRQVVSLDLQLVLLLTHLTKEKIEL